MLLWELLEWLLTMLTKEWNRIKQEAKLKGTHAGYFAGLEYYLHESIPSLLHTHTHTVAPQLCALSACWQVVGWGISEWSGFASTALMPQTKCSIQRGFPEQARGWRSDCLPDWLRSGCRTSIFVFVPHGEPQQHPSCHSDAPRPPTPNEYVAFDAYNEKRGNQYLFTRTVFALFHKTHCPERSLRSQKRGEGETASMRMPPEADRRVTWWLVFSLW